MALNKEKMKNMFQSWVTTIIGVIGAFAYAFASGAATCLINGQADTECLKNLAVSAAFLALGVAAKDGNKTGLKAVVLLLCMGLSLSNTVSAQTTQTTVYSNVWVAAPGVNGNILVNGIGGTICADSLAFKTDKSITLVSSKTPTAYITHLFGNDTTPISAFEGIILAQSDTDANGALTAGNFYYSNSGAGSIGFGLTANGNEDGANVNVTLDDFDYRDTSGNHFHLTDVFPVYSKADGGKVDGANDFGVYYGYGNGSVSGNDTVWITTNGLQSGNDLFRTINESEILVTVDSQNDSMLITKTVSALTTGGKDFLLVKLKYLTTIAGTLPVFATVPNGIRVKAIITGKVN